MPAELRFGVISKIGAKISGAPLLVGDVDSCGRPIRMAVHTAIRLAALEPAQRAISPFLPSMAWGAILRDVAGSTRLAHAAKSLSLTPRHCALRTLRLLLSSQADDRVGGY